jgi:hypothetical protein
MPKYVKETARIPLKFINGDTEDVIFEIKDRNHINIGEMFTAFAVSSVITHEYKGKRLPKKLLLIAVSEYTLEDE